MIPNSQAPRRRFFVVTRTATGPSCSIVYDELPENMPALRRSGRLLGCSLIQPDDDRSLSQLRKAFVLAMNQVG